MLFDSCRSISGRVIAALLIGAGVLTSTPAASSSVAQSVTLEVIVKFSDDSDAGRQIGRVIKEHSGDAKTLTDLQAQLHQSTGFALLPERITSGRELIVKIAEMPALETIKQTVINRPEIASVELNATQSENPRLPEGMLVVHFRESSGDQELLQKAFVDNAYGPHVQALATKLCADSGVPVLGSAQAGAVLAITLDRYALLEQLTARLNNLKDVDYAQPNSTVQFIK